MRGYLFTTLPEQGITFGSNYVSVNLRAYHAPTIILSAWFLLPFSSAWSLLTCYCHWFRFVILSPSDVKDPSSRQCFHIDVAPAFADTLEHTCSSLLTNHTYLYKCSSITRIYFSRGFRVKSRIKRLTRVFATKSGRSAPHGSHLRVMSVVLPSPIAMSRLGNSQIEVLLNCVQVSLKRYFYTSFHCHSF